MKDIVVFGALILGFALLITVHITIAVGLFRLSTVVRALVAFFAVPAAPVLAWQEHMRARAIMWGFAVLLYGCAWIINGR